MTRAIVEQDSEWFCGRTEKLRQEVAVLETQLTELEQQNSRTPALLQMLGKHFQVGAAGKLEGVLFKLKLKGEEFQRVKKVLAGIRQILAMLDDHARHRAQPAQHLLAHR